MTTIHLGDHTTDCATCKANCSCGTCEQNARIQDNMASDLDAALEAGDFDAFMDIFEDRDPFEFM
jgi:positive regulator of sigma E activity